MLARRALTGPLLLFQLAAAPLVVYTVQGEELGSIPVVAEELVVGKRMVDQGGF